MPADPLWVRARRSSVIGTLTQSLERGVPLPYPSPWPRPEELLAPQFGPPPFGGLWGGLGASWRRRLGDVLGPWPSWAVLGPSWAVLGPPWAVLGTSWAVLGSSSWPSWGRLKSFSSDLGPFGGRAGVALGRLGPFRSHLGPCVCVWGGMDGKIYCLIGSVGLVCWSGLFVCLSLCLSACPFPVCLYVSPSRLRLQRVMCWSWWCWCCWCWCWCWWCGCWCRW